MIDQLNKQHENLQLRELLSRTATLEVEKGTDVIVERGCGEWLEDMVDIIRIRLQTPYFDAQLTLCDKEMGYDHSVSVVEGRDRDSVRAKALASKVLSHLSVKETLLMMHEAHRMGLKDGADWLRRDIKRLLRI